MTTYTSPFVGWERRDGETCRKCGDTRIVLALVTPRGVVRDTLCTDCVQRSVGFKQ